MRAAAQADRQLRHRRRQRRRGYAAHARHPCHQHAGGPDRGHGGHDDGAHPGGAAPAGGRHGAVEGCAPQLKLIANFGTGVDNVDLDTARTRGSLVTNTPGVLTEDTADMTMALILAVPRRLAEGTALLKDA